MISKRVRLIYVATVGGLALLVLRNSRGRDERGERQYRDDGPSWKALLIELCLTSSLMCARILAAQMRAVNQPNVSAARAARNNNPLSVNIFLTYTAASPACFCPGISVWPALRLTASQVSENPVRRTTTTLRKPKEGSKESSLHKAIGPGEPTRANDDQ